MLQEIKKSECCNADAKIDGIPDFSSMVITNCYICSKCKRPCNIKNEEL